MLTGTVLASRSGPLWASPEPVWVVHSDGGGIHLEAIAALQADWKQIKGERDLAIHLAHELPAGPAPAAVVTLGSTALRAVQERLDDTPTWAQVPVLAALMPKEAVHALWHRPVAQLSAAYLDQPFERYLDLIKATWPAVTRVGLLVGPDQALNSPALFKVALDRGLKLALGRVARAESMYATLRAVLADSDVLLVLPDATVADAGGLQSMLITAYRQRMPVVAYSPAMVKAGAALGLYASPPQIGRQVSGMLKATLAGTRNSLRMADGITVTVNDQLFRSLGWSPPEASALTATLRR